MVHRLNTHVALAATATAAASATVGGHRCVYEQAKAGNEHQKLEAGEHGVNHAK